MAIDQVNGALYWVAAEVLCFGWPKPRPAMIIERVGPCVPVLPSTSHDMTGDPYFFHVPGDCVDFTDTPLESNELYSDFFLTCAAEKIRRSDLEDRIGQIREHVRDGISLWLASNTHGVEPPQ